ncbi:autotransporter-associated beta strand repeat-containing protein, partial [Sandarakinorhabdus sp.]|uniref:beta strand repeat-containing protein n=1 Tax=Sandarakinorhabdus sp. TaxID=1916663 RepID=UPI003340C725
MTESRSGNLSLFAATDSRRTARRLGWSVAATILAGTALVPASAQVFDLGGLTVQVTNFAGPPANNPAEITNGVLQVNNAANLTFGGDLTDSGGVLSIHKFGIGSLTLSGVNTYAGTSGLRVSNGTVFAGSVTAFSPNSHLLIGGVLGTTSTVDLNGFSQTTLFLQSTGAGGAVVTSTAGPATLTISGTSTRTFNGGLQGEVNIVKQGSSTQTFLNTKSAITPTTNTGAITLQAGTISVGANNVLGTGTITVTGASTLSSAAIAGSVTLNNAIVLDANLAVTPNPIAPLVLAGNISGAGVLNKSTSTVLALTGNNSYAGGTTVAGGRLLIGSDTALGLGAVTFNGGTLALNDVAVGRSITNNFVAGATALTIEAGDAGTVFEFSGNIAGTRTLVLAATGGDGTVLLSGANSYTGATRVQSGVLGIGGATAISNSSSIRLETSGTGIAVHTAGLTVDRQVTNLTGGGAVSATINTRGFDAELSGRLSDAVTGVDDLALTKLGAGVLTISNAATAVGTRNIVSGGVTVAAGTLNLTGALHNDVTVNAGTFAGSGSVTAGTTTIASGATLSPGDVAGGPDAIGRLTFTNLTLAGGSAARFDLGVPSVNVLTTPNDIVVVTGDLNLGGVLSVNGLVGFGNGSYRLFTFGGAVTGTLSLNVLPGGLAGSISVGAGVVDLIVGVTDFYWDGAGLANNIVDGGTGTWSSAGTNWTDVNGNTAVAWGNQLTLSNGFFRGAGGVVTLSDSFLYESLNFETDGYTLNPLSAQTLDGTTATINVATGVTATINAELAGTSLTKTGNGTLTLGGANTYSTTLLTAGRINVANDDALGPDGLTMSAGTTLGTVLVPVTLNNTIAVTGGVTIDTDASLGLINTISGSGGIQKTGAGQLTLSGNNNFTGNFAFDAGQIVVGSSTAFGNIANIVNAAAGTDGLILVNGVNVGNAIVLAG